MTDGQREILAALTTGPKTTRTLTRSSTHGTAYSRLRRLEDKEYVRRLGDRPARWELTEQGRTALQHQAG